MSGHELVDAAIEASEEASDVVVRYVAQDSNQVRFSNSEIDIAKHWSTSKMDVFIAMGRRVGSTQIEDPDPGKIEKRVRRLMANTRGIKESRIYGGISTEVGPSRDRDDLLDPGINTFGETAVRLVQQVIESAEEQGAKRVAGSLEFEKNLVINRTNHGGGGSFRESSYQLNVRSFLDPETSGQGLSCGRRISDAEERFVAAGEESGRIAADAEGGVQGEAGRYDLLASPTVAANLLGQLAEGANPLMMMLGLSPLVDRLGETLGPSTLSVRDEPHRPEGLGSRYWDAEGVPTQQVELFNSGRFVGMVHNTGTASQHGVASTGSSCLVSLGGSKMIAPWSSNIVFETGKTGFDEMVAGCDQPTIYVTSNWYTRFSNYTEGTFSTIPRDGIFLIEGGEIVRPIRKIRISDNIIGMISRISDIGSDARQVYWWEVETPTFMPYVKFSDVNITAATK